jgi:hypothetical protein
MTISHIDLLLTLIGHPTSKRLPIRSNNPLHRLRIRANQNFSGGIIPYDLIKFTLSTTATIRRDTSE